MNWKLQKLQHFKKPSPWFHKLKQHCVANEDVESIARIKMRASELIDEKLKLEPLHFLATAVNPKMKSMKMLAVERKQEVNNNLRTRLDGVVIAGRLCVHFMFCSEISLFITSCGGATL